MSGVGGHSSIQLQVRVITYPDRPGVARIYHGETLIFDAEGATVTDATIRLNVPFHTHFEDAAFAVAYRMETEK